MFGASSELASVMEFGFKHAAADRQTDRHTDARDHYISHRLQLTRNATMSALLCYPVLTKLITSKCCWVNC